MRYMFLYYNNRFGYLQKEYTRNFFLYYLYNQLDSKGQDKLLEESNNENDPNKVILWSRDNIKRALTPKDFKAHQNFLDYIDRYHEYSRKRFAEMPAIRISRKNYEQLKKQFESLYQRRPQYLIMREHDDGHVDMLEQDELSEQDIANMNREYKIFKNYEKRLEAYQKANPNRSSIWRSPEDNEFESDFALYDPIDEQDVD